MGWQRDGARAATLAHDVTDGVALVATRVRERVIDVASAAWVQRGYRSGDETGLGRKLVGLGKKKEMGRSEVSPNT